MNPRRISDFYAARRVDNEPMVLALVIDTNGSTYSKAGDYMIIGSDARFQGMLSGGCLEGDLAERSAAVIESGCPATVKYDLSVDDELFGLGVGCEGAMEITLLPLTPENDYEPFASICAQSKQRAPTRVALSSTSDAARVLRNGDIPGESERVFVYPPPPSLLVCGAGMDVEPLLGLAGELGWSCTVQDHRPAYLDARAFSPDITAHCVPAEQLASTLSLDEFDLAMVMSHHLVSDTAYLSQLLQSDIRYIGLLGPPHRRDRILKNLGSDSAALQGRLHAPAGLNLGGRGPGPIALSVVAEMQEHLAKQR